MSHVRLLPAFGLLFAVLAFAACSDDSGPGDEPAGPSIEAFTSTPSRIERGEPVTLSWVTRNAASIRLLAGATAVELGDAKAAAGSVELRPNETTTFLLEALGANGVEVSREVEVEVIQPVAPTILSFSAAPGSFGAGDPVVLTWKTKDAATISIRDEEGRPVEVSGKDPAEDSISLSPIASTTYELLAAGKGGEAKATVQVTLVPAPTASLEGEQSQIVIGGSAKLTWTTTDAVEVALRAEGSSEPLSTLASGEVEVSPLLATTYVLEAKGIGGTASASHSIAVQPVVDVFVATTTDKLRPGMNAPLDWKIRGATSATISNRAGWRYEIPEAELSEGSVAAKVGEGGIFEITAKSGEVASETKTASVADWLTDEPRVVEAKIDPAVGVTAGKGITEPVTLSWVVLGADRDLRIEKVPGGAVPSGMVSNSAGSMEVEIGEALELWLTAENLAGSHTVKIPVPVTLPPSIATFRALPSRVGSGDPVELEWETEDAAGVTLEKNLLPLPVDPELVNGVFEDSVELRSSYVLRAFNQLGYEVESGELVVDVGAPVVVSFTSSLDTVKAGGPLHFSWKNDGGTSLALIERAEGGGGADGLLVDFPR